MNIKGKLLWTVAVAVFMVSSMVAQNAQRTEVREQVKQYFDEQIAPLLVEQQTIYINALSEDEKDLLAEAKSTMNNNGQRKGKGQGRNSGVNQNTCWTSVTEIVNNHPEENEAYQLFIEEHKASWETEIQAIHDKNQVTPMRNSTGDSGPGYWIDRLENPEALLLLNPDQPFQRGMKSGSRKGNNRGNGNRQGDCMGKSKGMGAGNNQGCVNGKAGQGQGMGPRGSRSGGNMTIEQRAEIKSFVQQEVLPVIAEQRTAFDVNLSNEEKETIQLAREKREVRRVMFKAWHDSEDFVPGERRNDPNFDNMRADMQASMQAVRDIALAHQAEIREALDAIKTNEPAWENKIEEMMGERPQGRKSKGQGRKMNPMKKWDTPMAFLMFDPAKADAETLLDNNRQMMVTVYPNPVVNTGTIKINNAMDKNIVVTLFTKEGTKLQELFAGQANQDVFSVPFNTTSLDDGLYLIKIELDGELITRKVMIKH